MYKLVSYGITSTLISNYVVKYKGYIMRIWLAMHYQKGEYSRMIRRGSPIDFEFRCMRKFEVEKVWHDGKMKNDEKINTLMNRYRPGRD